MVGPMELLEGVAPTPTQSGGDESAMNNCYRNCLGGTAHIYLCWNLTYSSQNQNRAGKSVTNTLHQQA